MRLMPNPPRQIIHVEHCDSTNRQLLALAESGATAGTVYVARTQSAGKGRRGREWLAAPGHSLTFSLLWTLPLRDDVLNGLPLAVGAAVLHALQNEAFGSRHPGVEVGLKWPNDIYLRRVDGREAKAGGVLIESSLRFNGTTRQKEFAVVIGIGLNCQPSPALDEAVHEQPVAALSELFAAPFGLTPETLLPVLLDALFATLADFAIHGFAATRPAWNAAHLWQDRRVSVIEAGQVLHEGIALGVDGGGALQLQTVRGVERIVSGDVSLRPLD